MVIISLGMTGGISRIPQDEDNGEHSSYIRRVIKLESYNNNGELQQKRRVMKEFWRVTITIRHFPKNSTCLPKTITLQFCRMGESAAKVTLLD